MAKGKWQKEMKMKKKKKKKRKKNVYENNPTFEQPVRSSVRRRVQRVQRVRRRSEDRTSKQHKGARSM